MFLNSNSTCSLVVYRKVISFCILTLCSATLPYFFVNSFRSSSANNDSFIPSFPICICLISLYCLIVLARTSSMMLKSSGKRGHPCLVPDSGKASHFSLLSIMLGVGFFSVVHHQVEEVLFLVYWGYLAFLLNNIVWSTFYYGH